MQFTLKEFARLLGVNDRTIYRWIREMDLPAIRLGDQYRFNRTEFLAWATEHGVAVPPDLFRPEEIGEDRPSMAAAMEAGGVQYDVPASGKEEALRAVVARMPLPDHVDREFLLSVLLAREQLSSTGVGEGIAIPHPRNPIVLRVPQPLISLGFLRKPMDFGALDGQPVFAMFTLISVTVRGHLHLLSRLAFVLQDEAFRRALAERASADLLLSRARQIEAGLKPVTR